MFVPRKKLVFVNMLDAPKPAETGYVFWCSPCKFRHAGECVVKKDPVGAANRWEAHLPTSPLPECPTDVPWVVGSVVASCTKGSDPQADALVFQVTGPLVNRYQPCVILAQRGTRKVGDKINMGRCSYYGMYSKVLAVLTGVVTP